ncbi:MAG TPA: enoyl-CoA hydratase-related protein [Drouetiella sp.]
MTATQYQHLFLRKKRSGVAFLFFDSPGKHNFLTEEVLLELRDVLATVAADAEIAALILISGKGDAFISGASLNQIARFKSEQEASLLSRLGQSIFEQLEKLSVPTVAAINGICLGGGLELALSCRYRIATNTQETKLGLPEVNYGLIPGWGGTQRLPRIIGIEKGLEMILLGQIANASYAFKLGLLDMVVERDDLVVASEKFAVDLCQSQSSESQSSRSHSGESESSESQSSKSHLGQSESSGSQSSRSQSSRSHSGESESSRSESSGSRSNTDTSKERAQKAFALWRRTLKLRVRETHYPAPFAALDAIQEGFVSGAEAGFKLETEKFAALSQTEIARNLIDAFFVKELAKQHAAKLAATAPNSVSINLISPSSELLEFLKSRKLEIAPLEEADLVLDCNEQHSPDGALHRVHSLSKLMKPDAVLGFINANYGDSNLPGSPAENQTVSLDKEVDSKALTQEKPIANLLGLQLFDPLNKSQIVEIHATSATSKSALAIGARFSQQLSKLSIVVPDTPGHLLNRISAIYFLQAARLAESGVAIEHIEAAAREFGMSAPPLAVIDVIGLQQAVHIVENLHRHFGNRFSIPNTVIKALDAGLNGRATGEGFYLWQDGKRTQLNPKLELQFDLTRNSIQANEEDREKLAASMILPMVDEAARCIAENVVRRPREIDLAINLGINFPPFRGGLLRYADQKGIDSVIAQLDEIYQQTSPTTRVSDYLMRLKEQNRKFYSKE